MKEALIVLMLLALGATAGVVGVLWGNSLAEAAEKQSKEEEAEKIEKVCIQWRKGHFLLSKENLYNELKAQQVDYPDIVLAQALLETGNFKSYSCTDRNNLFGLRNGDGTYMSFEHWTLCVAAYKKYIQKYDSIPKDYYKYLDKLGYAEAPDYTDKLKSIVKK